MPQERDHVGRSKQSRDMYIIMARPRRDAHPWLPSTCTWPMRPLDVNWPVSEIKGARWESGENPG